ncbi:NAD(P)/FAD-dependent oxidoreductase [Aliamphritea hakodatensis]|uniref:NAD(P)/FAD-dependent oxidoreductase n=1 Tax=Aliamphritea hakodatensis TaxID=2895352 RepID=UPI0022FD9D26|nr:FAD-dependent oxidoreductase [Aliamphritea hakodatensis]
MPLPDSNITTDAPPLTVGIVGAGIIGLCTALEAQRKGYRVTLLDRSEPGLGASFGNAGYLATELMDPLSNLKTLRSALPMWLNPHGPLSLPMGHLHKILPWLVRFICAARPANAAKNRDGLEQLNTESIPAWKRCLSDIDARELLVKSGYLLVWETPSKLDDAKQHAIYMAQFGIKTELVQGERLAQLEPEMANNLSHALYFPEAYRVREPYQLCKMLFSAFMARDGSFIRQEVQAVRPQKKRVSVQTPEDMHQFDHAIICTGAWSKQLLKGVGLDVPLEAERGYHLTIDAGNIRLNQPIGSVERRFVMSPLDSGLRVVGMTELGGLDLKPVKRRFASLRHHSRKLMSRLNDSTLPVSEWMGHRPTLPDSLPVIDKHPHHPQLLFAFGNQHLGLTQAAISAELVVGLMIGSDTKINCEPYRVNRF